MSEIITETDKDPLGSMVLDYFDGKQDAFVEVDSTTLDMSTMTGRTMFRDYDEMGETEQLALHLCEGKIIDVGAGAGSHALYLQEQGKEVDALDISPGCIQVMSKRKIKSTLHQNIFSLKKREYTTVLMLMNGLGICGTLNGCNLFLQSIDTVLVDGGQVLADSTDMAPLFDDAGIDIGTIDGYYGETEFIMKYHNAVSDPFSWLYIDFDTLEALAAFNDLKCERLVTGTEGTYLARIFR